MMVKYVIVFTRTANGLSQCLSKPYGILFVDVEVCMLTTL